MLSATWFGASDEIAPTRFLIRGPLNVVCQHPTCIHLRKHASVSTMAKVATLLPAASSGMHQARIASLSNGRRRAHQVGLPSPKYPSHIWR